MVLETFGGSFSGRLIELGHAIARNYSKARSVVRLISSIGQFRFTVSLIFQSSLAHTDIEPCHPGRVYFLSPPTLPGATRGDHDPSSHTFPGSEASDHPGDRHALKREQEPDARQMSRQDDRVSATPKHYGDPQQQR